MEAEVQSSGIMLANASVNPPKPPSEPLTPKQTDPHLDREILKRIVPPVESATVTVQVFGIFSLPESWKTKVSIQVTIRYQKKIVTIT